MVCHSPDWNGRFCNRDVQPQQAIHRDQAFGRFATQWLHKAITDTQCDFLPFDAGSKALTATSTGRLNAFADKALRFVTQDAVDAGLQIWVYAQTGANDHHVTASGRSKAISDHLKTRLAPFGAAVQTVAKFAAQPWIAKPLQDNLNLRQPTLSAMDKQNRNFQGGMLFMKSFLDNPENLTTNDTPSLPRHYIVVAHEFGHMLGLIDEYFGVQCDRMKHLINQRGDLPSPNVKKTADRTADQQERFARLVEKSQIRGAAPIMGGTDVVTDSIMYAGNQILPAHYFTLWKALRNCTQSDLHFDDWTIEADNPHNAIHTLLQI